MTLSVAADFRLEGDSTSGTGDFCQFLPVIFEVLEITDLK